ncbi:MAG: class I SAM-dependent RNA methyltransferase [Treponema sp.]|nr:class I SAM-dependent RNA methyltransferase [Treponema sp.]
MALINTGVALCPVGAEKTVSNELRKMDFSIEESGYGRVRFKTGLEGLYRSLIGLRSADRLLLEAGSFDAPDFDALFEGVRRIPWEELIPPNTGLKVDKVRTNRSKLMAETGIQAVVHKAAAQKLCSKRGIKRLPDDKIGAELRVYIEKDRASILLDISGKPLFRRGYRTQGGPAPLRETTAAAIILLSGWKRKFPLYDPFCGSGTIAIEAALYAWDIAPGLLRSFALEQMPFSDKEMENRIREEFLSRVDFSRKVRISGSDSDATIVEAARSNLKRSLYGLHSGEDLLSFEVIPIGEANPGSSDAGFIITNPPYGRRLGDSESAERTYKEMGNFREKFPGWKLAVITDHAGFESFFGSKADSCREITNGAVQTYLFQYESLKELYVHSRGA